MSLPAQICILFCYPLQSLSNEKRLKSNFLYTQPITIKICINVHVINPEPPYYFFLHRDGLLQDKTGLFCSDFAFAFQLKKLFLLPISRQPEPSHIWKLLWLHTKCNDRPIAYIPDTHIRLCHLFSLCAWISLVRLNWPRAIYESGILPRAQNTINCHQTCCGYADGCYKR